ncbi:uncharacterized protein [Triticum aestivum]|uniref:uncharacterized protein isoform X2 n=1 Tax=Triticum aestivum TaxID=4565 RepID=UPI001D00469F|nr:uncharacterized protein LOC123044449 isoform X2 [Triticum aestivum]
MQRGRSWFGCVPMSTAALPVERDFDLPAVKPSWPSSVSDGGFAKGSIDLGGIEVRQVTTFAKVWSTTQGGQDGLGATFFKPAPFPAGFHALGHYAQPNNRPLFGHVLVARDASGTGALLAPPLDYALVWSSGQDGAGFFWLPTPPNGYKAVGVAVTATKDKPQPGEVMCVRADLTDACEAEESVWSSDKDGFSATGLRPAVRGIDARGVHTGERRSRGLLAACVPPPQRPVSPFVGDVVLRERRAAVPEGQPDADARGRRRVEPPARRRQRRRLLARPAGGQRPEGAGEERRPRRRQGVRAGEAYAGRDGDGPRLVFLLPVQRPGAGQSRAPHHPARHDRRARRRLGAPDAAGEQLLRRAAPDVLLAAQHGRLGGRVAAGVPRRQAGGVRVAERARVLPQGGAGAAGRLEAGGRDTERLRQGEQDGHRRRAVRAGVGGVPGCREGGRAGVARVREGVGAEGGV